MAGGRENPKISSHNPSSSSSSHRKSRWESGKNPKSSGDPKLPNNQTLITPQPLDRSIPSKFPLSDLPDIQPQPSYGFHMLDRRPILLADGTARTYYALPSDYDFSSGRFLPFPPSGPEFRHWNSVGSDGPGNEPVEGPMKRKYESDGDQRSGPYRGVEFRSSKVTRVNDDIGNPGIRQHSVDQAALKRSFLRFARVVNDNAFQRNVYLSDGKQGHLKCVVCGPSRSSKSFPDMHGLILHTYNFDNADLRVDHLALHKALCILMGWNYSKPPDDSKVYQILPANEAAENQDDLIVWPPTVIIHNTGTGKGESGRIEGYGNKVMDNKLKELGFMGGKAKSLYSREGHMGIALIRFPSDLPGLNECIRMSEFFERQNRGRKGWDLVQSSSIRKSVENNMNLVEVDETTKEKTNVLYGYLARAFDLKEFDLDTRKKVEIQSMREFMSS